MVSLVHWLKSVYAYSHGWNIKASPSSCLTQATQSPEDTLHTPSTFTHTLNLPFPPELVFVPWRIWHLSLTYGYVKGMWLKKGFFLFLSLDVSCLCMYNGCLNNFRRKYSTLIFPCQNRVSTFNLGFKTTHFKSQVTLLIINWSTRFFFSEFFF